METHPLAIGDEAEREEADDHQRPARREVTACRLLRAQAAPRRDPHRHQQQRRGERELHAPEAQALATELPRVPIQQLEAQAGVGVVEVPGQQRPPRQRTDRDRGPGQRMAQHATPLGGREQGDAADRDHRREAIVGQPADRQPQRKFQRRGGSDLAQQAQAGIQAQHGGEQQRHVRQGHQSQRPGQRQQDREAARLPAAVGIDLARRHPRDQPRNRGTDQQERQAQGQRAAGCPRIADPCQPRGHPRQVGIRPGEVAAFLPVERLVDEQRQARGQHQVDQAHHGPQPEEPAPGGLHPG